MKDEKSHFESKTTVSPGDEAARSELKLRTHKLKGSAGMIRDSTDAQNYNARAQGAVEAVFGCPKKGVIAYVKARRPWNAGAALTEAQHPCGLTRPHE
jgi:hypothetical protein